MLYLMRKMGQSIVINNDIVVKVVEVKGKNVKLGIEFPPTASVLREEIHEAIMKENLAASQADASLDMLQGLGNFNVTPKEDDA